MVNALGIMPFGSLRIIENRGLVHIIQIRKHRKKRINKKWLKRYGVRKIPKNEILRFGDTLICHLVIAQKIRENIPKF